MVSTIRARVAADFTDWTDDRKFAHELDRLVRALTDLSVLDGRADTVVHAEEPRSTEPAG